VEGFTLGELVDRHVMEHAEAIAKMASEAVQEGLLEESLQKVLCFVCTGAFLVFPLFRMRGRLCFGRSAYALLLRCTQADVGIADSWCMSQACVDVRYRVPRSHA
jgi:hypothetical protein